MRLNEILLFNILLLSIFVALGCSEGRSSKEDGLDTSSDSDRDTDSSYDTDSGRDTDSDSDTGSGVDTETETDSEMDSDTDSVTETDSVTDSVTNSDMDTDDTNTDFDSDTDTDTGTDTSSVSNRSAGCGKPLGELTTGKHDIRSADLDREYILDIPDNYDPNKPYRLIFGIHWMGGSMDAVKNDGYFRLLQYDTEKSVIWVAPQGYSDTSPWREGDDKDHIFYDDMLELFQEELCIDTERIFALGFSFGAMMADSLSQTHQQQFRAVCVYATMDYNIYFPDNTGEPLAYMGVHGLNDDLCPFDVGQRSKERFVQNNGCTKPLSVPEAIPGGDHVIYDYEGCVDYPVKWATFDGGHTDEPTDMGQLDSWAPEETWNFFTQF